MEYVAIKDMVLELIGTPDLKSFDFELISEKIKDFAEQEKKMELSANYEDALHEVLRDLVKERVISPVPHGRPVFFVNKPK